MKGDDLLKECFKLLVLKAATSAWRDGEFLGSLVLFAVYGALASR